MVRRWAGRQGGMAALGEQVTHGDVVSFDYQVTPAVSIYGAHLFGGGGNGSARARRNMSWALEARQQL